MNLFLTGGETTSQRLVVELAYLAVSAAIAAVLQFITNQPGMFPGQWVIIARLLLGLFANLANPAIKNS